MLSFMWHLSLEVVFYKATVTHLKEKNHTLHTKFIIQRKSTTKGPRSKAQGRCNALQTCK